MRPSGALLVVSPQDVAHLDAKKVLDLLQPSQHPRPRRPHCGKPVEVFPSAKPEGSIWSLGVARLGRLPIDPPSR
ncbi:MAG: hypothetical protein ACRD0K_28045 [Egibacteraceae bacterium]